MKRYDPLTYVYPRTLESAFGCSPYSVEMPQEPSLMRWWIELAVACAVVLLCVFIVRVWL